MRGGVGGTHRGLLTAEQTAWPPEPPRETCRGPLRAGQGGNLCPRSGRCLCRGLETCVEAASIPPHPHQSPRPSPHPLPESSSSRHLLRPYPARLHPWVPGSGPHGAVRTEVGRQVLASRGRGAPDRASPAVNPHGMVCNSAPTWEAPQQAGSTPDSCPWDEWAA